ncbi:hypothetical protein LNKW23_00390 [Paralimibaculum aggregatum]|uniref:Polyhydroxybutyrate depolymerase n=2 Tax=Paralimibaculum aggregatum TaxID=3036245 RepID=A0ABQ6LGM1_9RHOB|nr:hypothetical protein LNKW23_00390 [Limibaculum sp. NKW23]
MFGRMFGPMFGRMLRGGLLAALLAGPAAPAAAQSGVINPCAFSERDSACRVEDGEYRVLLPQGLGPFPALVYLYGSLGESRRITDSRQFREEIVRRGYALIVPQALDITYLGSLRGTGWGRRIRAARHPRDDVDFLRRVVFDARRRVNIDPGRIIWAGHSDGGYMVFEMACHHPEMGVAFASHAASYGGMLPRACRRPVRLLHTHSPDDRIVPFAGERRQGPIVDSADLGEALGLIARTNRCRRGPEPAGRFFGFERQTWSDCEHGSALDLLIHDRGHGWPAAWLPAVLDWYDSVSFRPAVSRTIRVGEPAPGTRRKVPGASGGFFKSVPK